MTIKIQAYQKHGIKTEYKVEDFEFCCWESLHKWLHQFHSLHKCPKCKANGETKETIL